MAGEVAPHDHLTNQIDKTSEIHDVQGFGDYIFGRIKIAGGDDGLVTINTRLT